MLKQLNSLTLIDTFKCLVVLEVTYQTAGQWSQVRFPAQITNVIFLPLLSIVCLPFCPKTRDVRMFLPICLYFILLSIFKILQDLWPIIRVSRYRNNIFNGYVHCTAKCTCWYLNIYEVIHMHYVYGYILCGYTLYYIFTTHETLVPRPLLLKHLTILHTFYKISPDVLCYFDI